MFTYDAVKDHPTLFKVLTGLTLAEFAKLQVAFQEEWDAYARKTHIDGKDW
jgi:hypothetical protein